MSDSSSTINHAGTGSATIEKETLLNLLKGSSYGIYSGGGEGILYASITRNKTLLVDVNVHPSEDVRSTVQVLLEREPSVGWGALSVRRNIRGLLFHVYEPVNGDAPLIWGFLCAYNSSRISKKQAQIFLQKSVSVTELQRYCDETWREGEFRSCQDAFSPVLLELMQEFSSGRKTTDDNLEPSKRMIRKNREVINEFKRRKSKKKTKLKAQDVSLVEEECQTNQLTATNLSRSARKSESDEFEELEREVNSFGGLLTRECELNASVSTTTTTTTLSDDSGSSFDSLPLTPSPPRSAAETTKAIYNFSTIHDESHADQEEASWDMQRHWNWRAVVEEVKETAATRAKVSDTPSEPELKVGELDSDQSPSFPGREVSMDGVVTEADSFDKNGCHSMPSSSRRAARVIQSRWRAVVAQRKLVAATGVTVIDTSGKIDQLEKNRAESFPTAAVIVDESTTKAASSDPIPSSPPHFSSEGIRAESLSNSSRSTHSVNIEQCAAQLIQSRWKATADRREYVATLNSIILIQSIARSHICKKNATRERESALSIQRCYLGYTGRTLRSRKLWSPAQVQAAVRGHLVRKQARVENKAARLIQSCWRATAKYQKCTDTESSVAVIQSVARGHACRNSVASRRKSTLCIQKSYLGYRKRRSYIRTIRSVVLVQAALRSRLVRQRAVRTKEAAQRIQSHWKEAIVRKAHKVKVWAIVKIQAAARSYCVKRKYVHTIYSVFMMQRMARGYLCRVESSIQERQSTSCSLGLTGPTKPGQQDSAMDAPPAKPDQVLAAAGQPFFCCCNFF